jgi:hypothetical protein
MWACIYLTRRSCFYFAAKRGFSLKFPPLTKNENEDRKVGSREEKKRLYKQPRMWIVRQSMHSKIPVPRRRYSPTVRR